MRKLSSRLGVAGVGLVLLTTVGCSGEDGTPLSGDGGSAGDAETAEPVVLIDVSGQQACDLLSPETLAKYVPNGRLTNSTIDSTETKKSARCDSSANVDGVSRTYSVILETAVPHTPDGKAAPGITPEEYTEEWLASHLADAEALAKQGEVNGITAEPPEEMAGAGEDGFTTFSLDVNGNTNADGYFRSGPFTVAIEYYGADRPNPDDRDNKQYLQKDVLVPAITEMAAEIDGNLAALSDGSGAPSGKPGELSGDALCGMLSDELIKRYLPELKDSARTESPGNGLNAQASCSWSSATPRPDSPGLRLRSGSAEVSFWDTDPAEHLADERETAQRRHDEGPVKEGPRKGVTYGVPTDVPGIGLAAWTQLTHSPPESPGASVTLYILLSGNRTMVISYGGSDEAELDTGTPGEGDLGEPATVPDDEVIGAVKAMAEELLPQLG